MLGLEPQKRNRSANNKNKVTKPKKDQKVPKKEEDEYIKSEPGVISRPIYSDTNARSTVKIKNEASQLSYHHSQFTPTSMGSPAGPPDCQPSPHMRLLTPASDDMLPTSHALQFSPQTGLMGVFDMPAAGHCGHEHDDHHDSIHDHSSWANNPAYSAFDAALNIEGYGLDGMCDHHSGGTPSVASGMHVPSAMGLGIPAQVDVKTEQWSPQYHR